MKDTSVSNLKVCKLHIQISNRHMCVEAGPASQDAVIKSISASPGLQCSYISCSLDLVIFKAILLKKLLCVTFFEKICIPLEKSEDSFFTS